MKRHYTTRNPAPRVWQVIPTDRARKIASAAPNEAEAERMFNRAATVTLRTRKAALSFIERIGGIWDQQA